MHLPNKSYQWLDKGVHQENKWNDDEQVDGIWSSWMDVKYSSSLVYFLQGVSEGTHALSAKNRLKHKG